MAGKTAHREIGEAYLQEMLGWFQLILQVWDPAMDVIDIVSWLY